MIEKNSKTSGIKQQSQSLIKDTLNIPSKSNENLDRRYYYIRICNIEKVHAQICSRQPIKSKAKKSNKLQQSQSGDYKAVLTMSLKKSDTRFQLNNQGNLVLGQRRRIKRQAHMFCFQFQQVMTMTLSYSPRSEKNKEHIQQQAKKKPIGFAKLLLTPFITAPETKHIVTVNMVLRFPDMSIQNQIAAVVTLQLYFLLQFKASLEITPCSADLSRNIANFGQMRPAVIFQINQQKKKSLIAQSGGIHPDWEDNARIVRQEIQNQQQSVDNFKSQQTSNKFLFDLMSAGHQLKLSVVNYPLVGQDATLIGQNTIRIQSCNFFRTPQIQFLHQDKNAIKLLYTDAQKNIKDAGTMNIKTKFNYDARQIRREIDSDSEDSDGWEGESMTKVK